MIGDCVSLFGITIIGDCATRFGITMIGDFVSRFGITIIGDCATRFGITMIGDFVSLFGITIIGDWATRFGITMIGELAARPDCADERCVAGAATALAADRAIATPRATHETFNHDEDILEFLSLLLRKLQED